MNDHVLVYLLFLLLDLKSTIPLWGHTSSKPASFLPSSRSFALSNNQYYYIKIKLQIRKPEIEKCRVVPLLTSYIVLLSPSPKASSTFPLCYASTTNHSRTIECGRRIKRKRKGCQVIRVISQAEGFQHSNARKVRRSYSAINWKPLNFKIETGEIVQYETGNRPYFS